MHSPAHPRWIWTSGLVRRLLGRCAGRPCRVSSNASRGARSLEQRRSAPDHSTARTVGKHRPELEAGLSNGLVGGEVGQHVGATLFG